MSHASTMRVGLFDGLKDAAHRAEMTLGSWVRQLPHGRTPLGRVARHLDVRVRQLDLDVAAQTHDAATLSMRLRVEYYQRPDRPEAPPWRLREIEERIEAVVKHVVAGKVALLPLEQLLQCRGALAMGVMAALQLVLEAVGYSVLKVSETRVMGSRRPSS